MRPTNPDNVFLLLVKAENRSLVEHLLKHAVDFVVIGGTALAYHSVRGVADVDDLDLLIAPTIENADRVASALAAAGSPLAVPSVCLARLRVQLPLKNGTAFWAEILTPDNQLPFSEIHSAAAVVTQGSLSLRVASLEHIRVMKKRAVCQLRTDLQKHEKSMGSDSQLSHRNEIEMA